MCMFPCFLQRSIVFFSHTLFQQFTHDGFFLQFMIYSFCNLSIRVQEKRDDTEEEALQNKGADSSAPQHAPNPQSSVLGATSEVTQLGPLFHICSNSQRTCLQFVTYSVCNLCVYRRKQMRMRRSHPITRRQMNVPHRTHPKPRDLQVAALQT